MNLDYMLDAIHEGLSFPENEGTKPPKSCPRCGYTKLNRKYDEFKKIYYHECFNMLKSHCGTTTKDGYLQCGYRWDYPKNREKEDDEMRGDIIFTIYDANEASEEWGFNCGPASLCAALEMTPKQIRPYLLDFERKKYTNPLLMANILKNMDITFQRKYECLGDKSAVNPIYPDFGLVRIQWAGPWTEPGVPIRARYRHTHWVAMRKRDQVFDINAVSYKWLNFDIWNNELVPFILNNWEPKATGEWWPTHCWEIDEIHQ